MDCFCCFSCCLYLCICFILYFCIDLIPHDTLHELWGHSGNCGLYSNNTQILFLRVIWDWDNLEHTCYSRNELMKLYLCLLLLGLGGWPEDVAYLAYVANSWKHWTIRKKLWTTAKRAKEEGYQNSTIKNMPVTQMKYHLHIAKL